MKTIEDRPLVRRSPGRVLSLVSGILGFIAIVLVLVILGGTAYAFFLKPEKAPGAIGAGSVNPGGAAPPAPGALTAADIFTGIGRLRIAVNSGEPATVLLSITFPYPGADRAFTEELAGKAPEFRSIAAAYFAALSPAELLSLDEAKAKAEILRRYNAELRLGKIEVLYFNDYMLLE